MNSPIFSLFSIPMINRIPFKAAANTILAIALLITGFHLLVLARIIPYSIVWGGRLTNDADIRSFELASTGINLVLACTVGLKAGYLRLPASTRILNAVLWVFTALFCLNTIGNLLSKSTIETVVFTPITAVLALLCARMAIHGKRHADEA